MERALATMLHVWPLGGTGLLCLMVLEMSNPGVVVSLIVVSFVVVDLSNPGRLDCWS